jgi:hypothetical protein
MSLTCALDAPNPWVKNLPTRTVLISVQVPIDLLVDEKGEPNPHLISTCCHLVSDTMHDHLLAEVASSSGSAS